MSALTRLALLASLLPLPMPRASAQGAPPAYARVDSAVLEELRRTNTPGAAVALVSGDRVVYAKGFGRTAADSGTAVTPATLFRIASVTKVFTAATLAALADAGRVDLDAPIGARLGALADPLRGITPHQLLSHTAGLTSGPVPAGTTDPATALAAAAARVPAGAAFLPPGEIFSYSNLGYMLAGRVIEVAGGRPYAEQVRASILAPLGMTATTFDAAVAARGHIAQGAVDRAPGSAPPRAGTAGGPEVWPAVGLYSSVLDLARFAAAFVNGGRYGGRRVLSPAAIARIAAPVASSRSGGEGHYGYGVRVYRHRGVDVVEHGGIGAAGFRSLLYMVPSRHVAVVVLANRAGRRPLGVADAALDALLPGALPPADTARAMVAMDPAEMARYVGRYENGTVAEVSVDDGVLTLHLGSTATPIRKLADGRLVAAGEERGNWVEFVPGADGAVRYLHFNMRAYRRL